MFNFLKKLFKKKPIYELEELFQKLGFYPIKSEKFYLNALTHSSLTYKKHQKNERLEFLGDAILNFIITDWLYHNFVHKNEGELTKIRAKIINRNTLNEVGKNIGLDKYIKHKLAQDNYIDSPNVIGNAFEAFIGAMYNDSGIVITTTHTLQWLLPYLNDKEIDIAITDFKSALHEFTQSKKITIHYNCVQNTDATYTVDVFINNENRGNGTAKTKKSAEQKACEVAMKNMKLLE